MIQELVYTSVPKGLAPDSQGFCTVAQTSGLPPNLSLVMQSLSGYRHPFLPGDERKALNPVVFLHVVRRVGGTDMHLLSRVSDCGVDYSMRSNLIAHHFALEDRDAPSCGPAVVLSQANLFRTEWNEKPHELGPRSSFGNPPASPRICSAWERQLGDAGWGGVVAERIENGDPISLIFDPGMNLLPLIVEALALLPPEIRWKTTFSTFFMKSQEQGRDRIQIKCILAGSEEVAFARLTSQTLCLNLRQRPSESPKGDYVEFARTGILSEPRRLLRQTPEVLAVPGKAIHKAVEFPTQTYDVPSGVTDVPLAKLKSDPTPPPLPSRRKQGNMLVLALIPLLLIPCIILFAGVFLLGLKPDEMLKVVQTNDAKQIALQKEIAAAKERKDQEQKKAEEKEEQEKADQEKKAAEDQAAAEKADQEKAEQEKKWTAEKTATEKAALEKKEREKKAEDEKAEREKKEAAERPDNVLNALPNFWSGLSLPRSQSQPLPNSKELWEMKDKVKLRLLPFVNWKNIDLDQRSEIGDDQSRHRIEFFREKETLLDVNAKVKEILFTVELNENGLVCSWGDRAANTDDSRRIQQLNRFLLSKLIVKIEGAKSEKCISMYEPAQYSLADEKRPVLGGKPFYLWKPGAKGFEVDTGKDESYFLLELPKTNNADEQEITLKPGVFRPVNETGTLLCFVSEFTMKNGDLGWLGIRAKKEDWAIETSVCTNKIIRLQEDFKRQGDELTSKTKEKTKAKQELNKTEKDFRVKNIEMQHLQQQKTNFQIADVQFKHSSEQLTSEINRLTGAKITLESQITSLESELGQIVKAKNESEASLKKLRTEMEEMRLDNVPFSIYLYRSEVPPSQNPNMNERLLLLEVSPSPPR